MRLNKFLSQAGICSRRMADTMISEGRVLINGTTATMGDKVSDTDEITVDGKIVTAKDITKRKVYAYNKPAGIVCSMKDQSGEGNSLFDVLRMDERVYPIGRLDKDSEGLLLLTNDGDLANEIMSANAYHEKEYEVFVDKVVTDLFLKKMSEGVKITLKDEREYVTRPCKVNRLSEKSFSIVLTEGKNRQIRRMCETLGYRVKRLRRIRIMNVYLGDLKSGKYREIDKKDLV